MMGDNTPRSASIVDDETFRKLELQYRRAVVKVFCPARHSVGGTEPWTGFAVNGKPCIILTVSHPVNKLNDIVNVRNLFHLNFFGDDTDYEAVALKCDFGCDLLVLICEKAPAPLPSFAFANLSVPIRSSTTICSIAHPELRAWSILRGSVCCDPFEIGPKHKPYNENMTIFDHDAALYPGASGAPIINLKGEVMGMQLSQLTRKLHGLCLKSKTRKPDCDYEKVTMKNFNTFTWEIKEFSLLKCDLRQAVTVQYMVDSLREMFPREAHVTYITDPNVFLRESVSRYWRRRGFLSSRQGIQPTKPPQGSSSGKRPWEESMLQSITVGNPKILHRHVEAADIFLGYISKAKASPLKLSRNKQTGQSAEFRSVEFLSHAAANNISQSYNGALVPNTGQAFRLNGSTFSTGERRQDVRGANVVVDAKTGRPKGGGFVRFGDENEKSRVMTEMNGQYCSRPTGKGVATPKKPSTPQQQYSLQVGAAANCAFTQGSHSDDDTSNTTVYVGGLDFDVSDEEVGQTFSQFGEVDSVKIPIGKGCGFVQFAERTSAENSINQLNGTFVGKQRVCLSWGRNPGNKQVDALLTKGAKGKNVAKAFGQALAPLQSLGEQQRAKWSNGNENIFRIPLESCIIRSPARTESHIAAIPSLLEDECLKRKYLNGAADDMVFSNLEALDLIALSCRERSLRLDVSASISERQKLVNSFNDKSKDEFAFLLICKAGGCGPSLIGGNRLVLFDPDWNSANDKQTAARVWRGGQKKVYQRQMSKEGLRKDIQKEQADLKNQGNFLSTEDLRDLFLLHENVSLTIERRGKESVAQPPPAEKRCVGWNSKMDALLTKGATGKNVAEAFGQAMAPW